MIKIVGWKSTMNRGRGLYTTTIWFERDDGSVISLITENAVAGGDSRATLVTLSSWDKNNNTLFPVLVGTTGEEFLEKLADLAGYKLVKKEYESKEYPDD